MKAAAYNLLSKRFNIAKLGKSTHYYTTNDMDTVENLKELGKIYKILEYHPLDKKDSQPVETIKIK